MKSTSYWLTLLIAVLLVKASIMFWFIQLNYIGLGPDEAQYWTWSQALDWGYYSKPPGIAWQIWVGTKLFGNTETGVRFGALILSMFLSLSTFALSLTSRCAPKTAFWAGICMALCPLGLFGSLFAITDGGLVLFWTLACIPIAYALAYNQLPNYYAIGLLILCGALFKWPIYFFWIIILIIALMKRNWFNLSLAKGMALSLFGMLPSLIWNWSHDWVTFRHVLATMLGGNATASTTMPNANFFEFIGSQIMLVSPIFFAILIGGTLKKRRRDLPPALLFCALVCLIPLAGYSFYSLFKKTQGNWCSYIYAPGMVFLCWYTVEQTQHGVKWLITGILLTLSLSVLVLSLPYIQSHSLASNHQIPYKSNPFKHNLGWQNLSSLLEKNGYDPNEHFLFSDKYQTTSLLSFYAPRQKRAYFFNLMGARKNQFSFWPQLPAEHLNKTGFFVFVENIPVHIKNPEQIEKYLQKLNGYFENVIYLGAFPLFDAYGSPVKFAYLFKCDYYNGLLPMDAQLY